MTKKILPFLIPLLACAPLAQANVDLVAVGKVDGGYQDLSPRTATALENGVAGNILGGVGSGLAYAGGNTFIALPDRGPNAVAYNPALDDTTSYINRFHTFNLALAVNPSYDALAVGSMPYILSPQLTATTLLSNGQPLTYALNGTPALNTTSKYYYTGRSDNFNPTRKSTNPFNARLDPEAVRVAKDGKSVFISDEYGPYIYQFNRTSGRLMKTFKLPNRFAVANPRSYESGPDGEIAANTSGRTANKGMEGLAITPDGTTLVGIMQANLLQDTKKYLRIVTIDIASGTMHEYAYKLTDGSGASDIVAINDHEFLVDERDGKGLGDGSAAVVKKLYKIDLAGATDVSGVATIDATTPLVTKSASPFLDVVAELVANGISATEIPAKIEGIAFGPDLVVNGVTKHTLFIANDNDFLPSVGGVANPNQFFVFTFEDADLPNLTPQTVAPFALDKNDRG